MSYFIGIDVGTSSAKAVVINTGGEVVFTTAPAYAFRTPQPLWAESDPADWWHATIDALKAITAKFPAEEIAAVGLTGQMHGLVLLGTEGEVLRPCIMWNDQRTGQQCAELTEQIGAERVIQLTGNPLMAGFTAPKIRWVQQNEPAVWDKAAKVLLPKDYIRYCLSGEFFTEVSDASGMSLLDVGARQWSSEMLEACGLNASMLATVTESTAASTRISAEAASLTGLKVGTPIIAGGGDQAAGAIGCGIVRPGLVSCSLGTSGVLFAHSETFAPDPQGRLHAYCAAVPGKWHYMGVQLSCAGSYQWFHDELGGGKSFNELNELAAAVPPGAEGLLFMPYLTGERMPYADPYARGGFIGLTRRHGLGHLSRAVLEGVSYGLNDGLEIMRARGLEPQEIIVSGGGAQSSFWRQLLADIFRTPIATVNATEGAAYGAAVLGAVGAGAYASVEAATDAMLRTTGRTEVSAQSGAYPPFYALYQKLYPALKDTFGAIAV